MGGPIAVVEEGDAITIDAANRTIQLDVDEATLKTRLGKWSAPAPRYTRGVLAKYASTVTSASEGAVTDKELDL